MLLQDPLLKTIVNNCTRTLSLLWTSAVVFLSQGKLGCGVHLLCTVVRGMFVRRPRNKVESAGHRVE